MSNSPILDGFRVVGGSNGLRRLVHWQAALAGHAACDPKAQCHSESYLSAFTFTNELATYHAEEGGVGGYSGPCGASWLWFDLDDGDHPERALDAARRLCEGIVERYIIGGDDLLVFFSGSKGYHVGVPMTLLGSPAPSTLFHRVARRFAEVTAERLHLVIDSGVYDRVRLFRSPNSQHQRTGRYKRRVTFGELMSLQHDAIERLAAVPAPFDVPKAPALDAAAVADWNAAAESVKADDASRAERRTNVSDATLNRQTLAFIRDGALVGDRHRLLFSAAANLGEFGATYRLAYALLEEAALDSGLTPSDIARQIRDGVERGQQ